MSIRRNFISAALLTAGIALAQNTGSQNQNQAHQANQPPRAPGQITNANAEPTQPALGTPGLIADPTSSNGNLTWDQQFIMNIALRGMREIDLAKIAATKSSNPSVTGYAAKVIEEQSRATGSLKRIAGRQSIAIPAGLDPKEQAEVDRIGKLSGEEFDQAYARDQVRNHERSLREFQREIKEGQDEQVKAFAVRVMPTVEAHLQTAKDLAKPVMSKK